VILYWHATVTCSYYCSVVFAIAFHSYAYGVFIFEEKCTILTADLSFLVENIVQWQVVEGFSELTFIASVYGCMFMK